MARPSFEINFLQPPVPGPRIPALHPAAPPTSSFAPTPMREGRGTVGGIGAHYPIINSNTSTTNEYDDLMRLVRATNREAMHQEVSSPRAGGGFDSSAEGRGRKTRGGGKQTVVPLNLPIKRRHSEVGETHILPPSPSSHQLALSIYHALNNTSPSAPTRIPRHSHDEMQALAALQTMGSNRDSMQPEPEPSASHPLPSIEDPIHPSITVAAPQPPPTSLPLPPLPPPPYSISGNVNLKKIARDHLFDAVVAANMRASGADVDSQGNPLPPADNVLWRRTITGPDDLERAEAVRLFEILEACSLATQPDTPMATTRGNIDRFFDAIFKNWEPEGWDAEGGRTAKPDFVASAETVAGKVCAFPSLHHDVASCLATPECDTDVVAKMTYVYTPHSVTLEFFIRMPSDGTANGDDSTSTGNGNISSRYETRGNRQQLSQPRTPTNGQPISSLTSLNPTDRDDIRWLPTTDWAEGVREDLQKRVIARLHKYNKHQAIWQARRFIQGWAWGALPEGSIFDRNTCKGVNGLGMGDERKKGMSTGIDGEGLGFLTADGAKMSLQILNTR